MRRRLVSAVLLAAAILYGWLDPQGATAVGSRPADAIRIVTWNLRNFPVDPRDARDRDPPHDRDRLRSTIDALQADVLAFQEVRDVEALAALLRPDFEVTATRHGGPRGQHLALAWRTSRIRPTGPATEHEAIALGGRLRPALSAPFVLQSGGRPFNVMAVHLKARPAGASIRTTQWDHLTSVVERLLETNPDLVLVGDFNVTGGTLLGTPPDERLALETRLAESELTPIEVGACTSYWHGVRHDDWVEPARLDLAFAAGFADAHPVASVGTHCRRHRCEPFAGADVDPSFTGLSDHCPVVVDMIQNADPADPGRPFRD